MRFRVGLPLLVAVALTACGEDEQLAAACHSSPQEVRSALEAAPDPVRVNGERISGCTREALDAGELETIGTAYVETAEELARTAAQDEQAALRLGYLVGAVRAAAEETGGLHDELRRRLEQAIPPRVAGSPAFGRGERAGRESG